MSEQILLNGADLSLVTEALRNLADHYNKSVLSAAYAGEGRWAATAAAYQKLVRCGELAKRLDDFPEALLTHASIEEVEP